MADAARPKMAQENLDRRFTPEALRACGVDVEGAARERKGVQLLERVIRTALDGLVRKRRLYTVERIVNDYAERINHG